MRHYLLIIKTVYNFQSFQQANILNVVEGIHN